jgi:hypothetical protein
MNNQAARSRLFFDVHDAKTDTEFNEILRALSDTDEQTETKSLMNIQHDKDETHPITFINIRY